MNIGISDTEYAILSETFGPLSSVTASELDLLRIILNGLDDLSFNQVTCTEDAKLQLQQVEHTVTSHFRFLYREMQALRADLARNRDQLQHLMHLLQPPQG